MERSSSAAQTWGYWRRRYATARSQSWRSTATWSAASCSLRMVHSFMAVPSAPAWPATGAEAGSGPPEGPRSKAGRRVPRRCPLPRRSWRRWGRRTRRSLAECKWADTPATRADRSSGRRGCARPRCAPAGTAGGGGAARAKARRMRATFPRTGSSPARKAAPRRGVQARAAAARVRRSRRRAGGRRSTGTSSAPACPGPNHGCADRGPRRGRRTRAAADPAPRAGGWRGSSSLFSALFLELPARLFALRAEGHAFLRGSGQRRSLQPGRLGPLRRRRPGGRRCLIGRRGLEEDNHLAVDDLAVIVRHVLRHVLTCGRLSARYRGSVKRQHWRTRLSPRVRIEVARQTVLHDEEHPSHLLLSIEMRRVLFVVEDGL